MFIWVLYALSRTRQTALAWRPHRGIGMLRCGAPGLGHYCICCAHLPHASSWPSLLMAQRWPALLKVTACVYATQRETHRSLSSRDIPIVSIPLHTVRTARDWPRHPTMGPYECGTQCMDPSSPFKPLRCCRVSGIFARWLFSGFSFVRWVGSYLGCGDGTPKHVTIPYLVSHFIRTTNASSSLAMTNMFVF